jgi:hypothetical protein
MKFREIAPVKAAGLLVLVIDVWLTLIVASELLSDQTSTLAEKVEWNANLATSAATIAKQKPVDSYREIVAHPVFFKSREPWVAPPPPPPIAVSPSPPPAPVDPGLELGGVMIRNDLRKAYVFSRGATNGGWIKEGDDFMGWKIVSITKGAAKLQQAGRSIDLLLYPER